MTVTPIQQTLELVRFALHPTATTFESSSTLHWDEIWKNAYQQGLVGLICTTLERLPKPLQPSGDNLLEWAGAAHIIRERNLHIARLTYRLAEDLRQKNYRCILLKGSAAATRYPQPLLRKPGDIDLWVRPPKGTPFHLSAWRKEFTAYVRTKSKQYSMAPHHIGVTLAQRTTAELHFTPLTMHNPLHNSRIQRWFDTQAETLWDNQQIIPGTPHRIAMPTAEFDAVYQLAHIYHHLFEGGMSLRLIADYYFVVSAPDFSPDPKEFVRLLRHLGLYRFATAVSYVLEDCFQLPPHCYPVTASAPLGKRLKEFILRGGEFGMYGNHAAALARKGSARRFAATTLSTLRLVRHYPYEALAEPFSHLHRFLWRTYHERT